MNVLEVVGVPYYKKGKGIHIKKKNRGKFTEYCNGKVTQECINKAKNSGNPTLKKRAVFAENSRKWSKKHQLGGWLQKIKYMNAPTYEAQSLQEAITKAYNDGNKGKDFWYNGNVYKAEFNPADERKYEIAQQHEKNRSITDEQVVDAYIDNVLWTMENPTNKGLKKDGKYYSYKDSAIKKNLGPGIAYTSNMGKNLDYSKGYTKEELNAAARAELLPMMKEISAQMKAKYGNAADTMSLGNRMIQLDIAHNVRPRGSKKANMPITGWPSLSKAFIMGNDASAKKNMYSGSSRRDEMRKQLLWKNIVSSDTVVNK